MCRTVYTTVLVAVFDDDLQSPAEIAHMAVLTRIPPNATTIYPLSDPFWGDLEG